VIALKRITARMRRPVIWSAGGRAQGAGVLTPRLALLTLGTVVQTVTLGLWMAAGGAIDGVLPLLPLLPQAVYAALELAALGAVCTWLALQRPAPPPVVILFLGLLPLLLAWRSLVGYFVWLLAMTVYAAIRVLHAQVDGSATQGTALAGPSHRPANVVRAALDWM
jgi:hypothetical protein